MSKLTLDLSNVVIDQQGKPFTDGKTYAEALSSDILHSQVKGYDSVKLYEMAVTLNTVKKLDLDTSDMETIKRFVVNDSQLFVLLKGPILKAIAHAKEAKTSTVPT